VNRRALITLAGGAAAWPMGARAQQPSMPTIGYLYSGAPETGAYLAAAFRQGLGELGFVEGRNVAIDYRWAENQPARLPELAAELVRRRVTVIATLGTPSCRASAAYADLISIQNNSGLPQGPARAFGAIKGRRGSFPLTEANNADVRRLPADGRPVRAACHCVL
jgi:hypothetical protein